MENNVPNLDCMSSDAADYFKFGHKHDSGSRKRAQELFPSQPKGYVKVANDLAHYAYNKGTAMRCRERGDVNNAQTYETICDNIYAKLPEWARW